MVGSKVLPGGFVVGEALSIVGLSAVPLPSRTPKAIELMGPRHCGFDVDHVPIEKLHGKATE